MRGVDILALVLTPCYDEPIKHGLYIKSLYNIGYICSSNNSSNNNISLFRNLNILKANLCNRIYLWYTNFSIL